MHPIFHSFKRLYWSSMRFSRDWGQEYGITPARLDVLIVLAQGGGGVSQSDIHRTLDVCAPVISRMLDSLEELKLVERRDHPADRRRNWVALTRAGLTLLRAAVADLFADGFTERCLWQLVAPGAKRHRTVKRAMEHARACAVRQRDNLSDVSTLRYPGYLRDGRRSPDHPVDPRDGNFRPRRAAA